MLYWYAEDVNFFINYVIDFFHVLINSILIIQLK